MTAPGSCPADYLLVNINNTRTKLALAGSGAFLDHRVVETGGLDSGAVHESLAGWSFSRALIASVVPAVTPLFLDAVAGLPAATLDHRSPLNVAIDFPDPSTVGADRIANACAVADRAREQPVIVVDFGTAVTFDIVDERPAYIGGVIAPGLDVMRSYLHNRTALLPLIELKRPSRAIGRSTEEAMQAGAFHGYRGLVREIIGEIEKELKRPAKIIATGGYADLIASGFPEIASVEPLLTMEGLLSAATIRFSDE